MDFEVLEIVPEDQAITQSIHKIYIEFSFNFLSWQELNIELILNNQIILRLFLL